METFAREESTARSIFDDSAEESRKHVFYASNQGVYTLFFALDGLIGAILACVSHGEGTLFVVDNTLAIFATASMLRSHSFSLSHPRSTTARPSNRVCSP
ncbi:hypothetical protein QP426_06295 [Pauljensenia sp. UMB1235]|uniref:hypothetical protein n=1 Tax=unclassified Pauljensenia TaxID=2908895 RepID=UPI00255187A4|nr:MULTISPECIES: hypothetical protein [unclassified Pauljensenia]MDK6400822.1 hypothetical protein [Pauljensenia sp. UMB9872]MDK7173268.1 hypothetical protein [Pauljensenia sp. UMB1235]